MFVKDVLHIQMHHLAPEIDITEVRWILLILY